jgi:hypothetical protein
MSNRLKTVATNIETHNEIIVDSEGNVKEITQREVSSKKIPAEPNFIKLYLQDICKLNDLPKTSSKLFVKRTAKIGTKGSELKVTF